MKQSSNKKSREATAFLYERLSRDDNLEGESYSIGNQKKLLTKVAKEKGYTNLVHFLDDGISGVTMNRPGFVEMMQQLEQGKASAVFVKDLSRLGRNYIEVGRLTEEFFPDHDIRLVAVSDNIDTAEGENELAPIRNLFNEWYARDISKKRRISNKIKGNSGEPMGLPPYGYIKDPNNPKYWVIDEEAAQVVRRIFDMTLEGFGTEQIATQFEKEGILTPQAYWIQKGIGRPGKSKTRPATKWNGSTITHLLYQQEYCGDVLNFKTYSKSYKNKKRIHNDPENWVVCQDVHEPIIERAVFEQVQQKRGKMRKRRTSNGEHNMFSGLLVCADCGCNLHFHFNQGNPEIKCPPGRTKFITAKKLSKKLEKEQVLTALSQNIQLAAIIQPSSEKKPDKIRKLVDIQANIAAGKGIGYERWAKKFNLKRWSQTLCLLQEKKLLSEDALHQRIAELQTQHDDALAVVKDLDARMVSLKELRGHLVVYRQYKPLAQKLQTVRNPAKFKEQHRAELAVYEAACAYFKANGLRTLPDLKKLDAEYQTLSSEKNGFYTRYKKAQIELRELRTAQQNVEAFFRKEERSHAVPQQEIK